MSTPKERGILFTGPMVRAILDGRKTETRRVYRPAKGYPRDDGETLPDGTGGRWLDWGPCPYGRIGDRLWVRETWAHVPVTAYRMSTGVQQTANPNDPGMAAVYRSGWERSAPGRWRPSIHMPRWASRITLEVEEVRLERLQDLTPEDVRREGVVLWDATTRGEGIEDVRRFGILWDSINAGRGHGWDANPWVWVIRFRRLP